MKILQKQCDEYKETIEKYENELQQQKGDIVELKDSNDDLKHQNEQFKEKMAVMQAKMSKVGSLEQGLLEFHMEIKNRMNNHPTNKEKNMSLEEKLMVMRQSHYEPMALLEELRTNVRVELSFKDDYEEELKCMIENRKTKFQKQIDDLNVYFLYLFIYLATISKCSRCKNRLYKAD